MYSSFFAACGVGSWSGLIGTARMGACSCLLSCARMLGRREVARRRRAVGMYIFVTGVVYKDFLGW